MYSVNAKNSVKNKVWVFIFIQLIISILFIFFKQRIIFFKKKVVNCYESNKYNIHNDK